MVRLLVSCLLLAGSAAASSNGLVVLLTDYGSDSMYVGVLKGAIYTKYPEARIDAISNAVPPYDIAAGALLLLEACAEFPAGTTFCCIVDPGVGTERKCVVLHTKNDLTFVAPDNGLLAPIAQKFGIAELREADNKAYWREGVVSSTFHGRDIFGPVAASLAHGVSVDKIGSALDALVDLKLPVSRVEDDVVQGAVIRSDAYGNLITNVKPSDLESIGLRRGDKLSVTIGGATFTAPWAKTYSDVIEGEIIAVVQSAGFIEFAVNKGDLAGEIGQGLHAEVRVRKAE